MPPTFGYGTALFNGMEWQADSRGNGIKGIENITLVLIASSFKKNHLEWLSFSQFPMQTGEYRLHRYYDTIPDTLAYSNLFLGIDHVEDLLLQDTYRVSEEDTLAMLKITSVNHETQIMTGEFQGTYIRDTSRPNGNPDFPDTIRFMGGKFKVKLRF